ncbi:hypothetical protein K8R03_03645 [Candidatus Kaiserbacteria bacterium]|nr:hypothetical protein [Candidatus Kaiserbacteria bacterium]
MEGGIQSSFIPKDAGKAAPSPRLQRGGGLNDLLVLISVVLFVASAALAGAVLLYKQYLESSSTSKVAQLQRARQAFEPALIQELTRLDDRMRSADVVLSAHIAPTAFFDLLSQATLTTVSFQTLDLEAGDPKNITIKMQGIAQSVNSIALEADLMAKNGVITSPIFSDISRQPDGVHFNLSALINPAAINYVALVSGRNGSSGLPQQTQQVPAEAQPEQTPSFSATTTQSTGTGQGTTTPVVQPKTQTQPQTQAVQPAQKTVTKPAAQKPVTTPTD